MKMSKEQILDLIGEVEPVGIQHVDDKVYDNLQFVVSIVDSLISKIDTASQNKDRQEYSMNLVGETADNYLNELAERLNERNE